MDISNNSPSSDDVPFCFLRGSDPRAITCRGKLQTKRCKLNQEINKELRLRAGAENLYKATTNRKLRDTVALELSFVNSNLQLLKEKLSELNSSVEIYQNDHQDAAIPMIPLGLKETKEVNFMEPFSDFILEHYSDESTLYEDAIADITDTRQAARTPTRDGQGVGLLFRYYNLLYFVERRFFPPDRTLGIYFEWFDSLTGVPSCQRTVAFEKACVLFNLGAIYTQIGARQDRTTEKGLDSAVDSFLRAAGIFKHICETFTNAPSMDLKPQILDILVALMLAQARECLYEKLQLQVETLSLTEADHIYRDLSGEAAQLRTEYNDIHMCIQTDDIHTYVPECWTGFVALKAEYYKALSHYHAAKSINIKSNDQPTSSSNKSKSSKNSNKNKNQLDERSIQSENSFIYDESILDSDVCPEALKLSHIREAMVCHEEAQRLQRMNRELKSKKSLSKCLQESHLRIAAEFELIEESKGAVTDPRQKFDTEVDCDTPTIQPCSKFTLSLTGPDFTNHKIDDPFKRLGPIAIFSARRHWTAPRNVRLQMGGRTMKIDSDGTNKSGSAQCNCRQSIKIGTATSERYDTCEVCTKYKIYTATGKKDENSDRNTNDNFGFQLRGDAPVIISYVELNSLADLGGIKEGDFIVEISGIDVKWYTQKQVTKIIQNGGQSLELKVITPIDRNYLKPITVASTKNSISIRSIGSSSGVSSGTPSPTGTTSKSSSKSRSKSKVRLSSLSGGWNPFRRTQSMGKII